MALYFWCEAERGRISVRHCAVVIDLDEGSSHVWSVQLGGKPRGPRQDVNHTLHSVKMWILIRNVREYASLNATSQFSESIFLIGTRFLSFRVRFTCLGLLTFGSPSCHQENAAIKRKKKYSNGWNWVTDVFVEYLFWIIIWSLSWLNNYRIIW